MKPNGTLLFEEEQRLDPLMAIVVPMLLVVVPAMAPTAMLYFVVPPELRGEATRPTLFVSGGLLLGGIPLAILPGLLMHVVTQVRTRGVFVRTWPLPFIRVPTENALSIHVITYNPWRYYEAKDLLSLILKRKRVVAARGGKGVLLEYPDGSSMLIGTQSPERLMRAIHSLREEQG